jgi:transcriptional regulator with XRE-family HTH domain
MENELKSLRLEKGLSQKEASSLTTIPLRTYKNYENDVTKKEASNIAISLLY